MNMGGGEQSSPSILRSASGTGKNERFIENVKDLPELIAEFDTGQWAALVDSMTVHSKDRITFTLTCGVEIEA